MSDTNIRAAKALRWYLSLSMNAGDAWMKDNSSLNYHYDFIDDAYTELKFTTSYDWAMLGVHHMLKVHKPDGRMAPISAFYRCMEHKVINDDGETYPIAWHAATPEQITLAWLEVLEK